MTEYENLKLRWEAILKELTPTTTLESILLAFVSGEKDMQGDFPPDTIAPNQELAVHQILVMVKQPQEEFQAAIK